MKKHEVICLVSMFPFCVCLKKFLKRSWNCLKTGVFFQSDAELSKKFKSVKEFTNMHPKGLVTHFSKNSIFHYAMMYCFEDIEDLRSSNFVKLLPSQHTFWYFNCQYFMNGGSDPYRPYHWPKEYNENFQIHIYKLL